MKSDCYWCKKRSCYLCLCIDKEWTPGSFPPGRSVNRCQDCGMEYCDACFHRDEHELCRDGKEKTVIPSWPLKSVLYNTDREDDVICLHADYYLKEVVKLVRDIKTARDDKKEEALNEQLDKLELLIGDAVTSFFV